MAARKRATAHELCTHQNARMVAFILAVDPNRPLTMRWCGDCGALGRSLSDGSGETEWEVPQVALLLR